MLISATDIAALVIIVVIAGSARAIRDWLIGKLLTRPPMKTRFRLERRRAWRKKRDT